MKILSLFLIVTGLTLGGCCDENFINPDYDFREYAIDISGRMFDGCLYEPEFTTEGATPDGEVPYCSNNRIQTVGSNFSLVMMFIFLLKSGVFRLEEPSKLPLLHFGIRME